MIARARSRDSPFINIYRARSFAGVGISVMTVHCLLSRRCRLIPTIREAEGGETIVITRGEEERTQRETERESHSERDSSARLNLLSLPPPPPPTPRAPFHCRRVVYDAI